MRQTCTLQAGEYSTTAEVSQARPGSCGPPVQGLERVGAALRKGSDPSTQSRQHRPFRTDSVGVNQTRPLVLGRSGRVPVDLHLGSPSSR